MPSKERITYLFQRFFDKTCTTREKEELMEYISRSEHNEQLKELIDQTWEYELPQYSQSGDRANEIFRSITQHQAIAGNGIISMEHHERRRPIQWLRYAAAAAAVLVLAAGFYWFLRPNTTGSAMAQSSVQLYKAEIGEMKTVQLPDGSVVTINANSSLRLTDDFNKTDRQIELRGEAFFKVAHNAAKPFIIRTPKMNIRVLGTTFNVKAYPDDQTFETSLIQGSVEVSLLSGNERKVVLKPNEKIVVENKPAAIPQPVSAPHGAQALKQPVVSIVEPVTIDRDSSILEISWTNNQLAFFNNTFEEIARKIERWYGVTVKFGNESVKQYRFTITIEKQSLDIVMKALQMTRPGEFDYQFNQTDKTISIK